MDFIFFSKTDHSRKGTGIKRTQQIFSYFLLIYHVFRVLLAPLRALKSKNSILYELKINPNVHGLEKEKCN